MFDKECEIIQPFLWVRILRSQITFARKGDFHVFGLIFKSRFHRTVRKICFNIGASVPKRHVPKKRFLLQKHQQQIFKYSFLELLQIFLFIAETRIGHGRADSSLHAVSFVELDSLVLVSLVFGRLSK